VQVADAATVISRTRLDSLTGLRFIAAFGVFGYHVLPLVKPNSLFRPLFMGGQAGVSFFFVLSGFVLTWSYQATVASGTAPRAANFWRRRVARIMPSQIVTWALAIPVVYWTYGAFTPPARLLSTLTLTQAWVPSEPYYFGGNGVAWSLSCEALFYLCFPAVIGLVMRASLRARWLALGACVLALAAIQLGTWAYVGAQITNSTKDGFWFVSVLPLTRLPEFLFGMLVAAQVRAVPRSRIGVLPAALLTLVALYVSGRWFPSVVIAGWVTVVPFGLLIATAAISDLNGRRSVLTRGWAVRLGEWSFAFYLTHQLVLRTIADIWPTGWSHLPQVLLDLGLSLLACALLHHLVEVPAERRLRGSRTPARVEADAVPSAV
jgi:peptidoglycan/LPS O-acetylase OafA/YrhL